MQRGFSLVELSIVLVILGLLTGGILAGQSLIRAAELRAVTTEYQRYVTATQTFRDKYMAIPGDMRNAVRFWGAQEGGASDGVDSICSALTTAATGTATCNGNGDGNIGPVNSVNFENYRFWQHLANAGLIEGSYSGVSASTTANSAIIGLNVPPSKLKPAGYSASSISNPNGTTTDFPSSGNNFWFGGQGGAYTGVKIIKPIEAWNIDTKLDDGKPGTGMVLIWRYGSSVPNCTTSSSSLSAQEDAAVATYSISLNSIECALRLMMR